MILQRNGEPLFPLGFYELPRDEGEWRSWSEAGVNLVCCRTRDDLDRAAEYGMFAWVPVPMIVNSAEKEAALREKVSELVGHPAIAVWEAPDEAIWRTIYFGDDRARFLWQEPEDRVIEVRRRREELVAGLKRGAAIIRELDPGRPLWLNEATGSDFDTLARCLPDLDIVGCDFYPVETSVQRPLHKWGPILDRFRRVAPRHELWSVQQAFSWTSLPRFNKGQAPAYPNTEQARFTAWQTIMHGATGLLWWGSSHEDRPAPFLDEIMVAIRELSGLHPFLTTGKLHTVGVNLTDQMLPVQLGVSGGVWQAGDARMLALVCEDPWGHEVTVTGLDSDPNEMRQVIPGANPFVRTDSGWTTLMEGYEVRAYTSGG